MVIQYRVLVFQNNRQIMAFQANTQQAVQKHITWFTNRGMQVVVQPINK